MLIFISVIIIGALVAIGLNHAENTSKIKAEERAKESKQALIKFIKVFLNLDITDAEAFDDFIIKASLLDHVEFNYQISGFYISRLFNGDDNDNDKYFNLASNIFVTSKRKRCRYSAEAIIVSESDIIDMLKKAHDMIKPFYQENK